MRLILSMLLLASPTLAGYGPMAPMRQPSVYGDARHGCLIRNTNSVQPDVLHKVILPTGQHQGFTVSAWMRLKTLTPVKASYLTTHAFWCPEPIVMSSPDLLAGAGAHGTVAGTNLTDLGGVIVVSNFPFSTYTNAWQSPVTSTWPRGVYTIAGWSSNEVTVSLGGTDSVLGPGDFNVNRIPGPTADVSISGTGLVAIGISQTPCYRYFDEIDGVTQNDNILVADSCISTEITFCVWRFKIDGTNQIYRSDLGRMAAFDEVSQISTNTLPLGGCFDSRGDYRIGLMGLSFPPYDYELFDARVFSWYLSDAELERVHYNGVQEINRRGIPQWR